jgi:hypothetical protein
MTKYNGHKNWNHWNVSLWINNDEGLYRIAQQWMRISKTRVIAATEMCAELEELGITRTPDGAPYSVTTIRAAMVGM